MATETMQPSDIDMKDQSFSNNNNHDQNHNVKRSSNLSCELLNTSSTFQLTTPFRNDSAINGNNNHNVNINNNETPSRPLSTPSIPNTQLRNLHITTPNENTENKEESEELLKNGSKSNDNCIINDNHSYITIIENKQLQKIADSYPNKCYNRIQAKNLNKLDQELQTTIDAFLAKKRKKLQQLEAKKREKANANKKLSDKQEKDENDDDEMEDKNKDENKNKKTETEKEQAPKEEISNENKLEIIEKALNACKQQLMYYNKLFLNPIPMSLSASNRNHVIMNKEQILTDKKEIKSKIEKIKAKIDERRKKLMHHIQHLNKLRDETKKIEVKMPQIIRDKIVKNIEYNEQNQNFNNNQNEKMKIETEEIVAMINNNKKKKFIEMKQKFEDLKANEMKLKERAQKLSHDEDQLRQYIDLKMKNKNKNTNDDDNDTIMSIPNISSNNHNKHRNISMESSISVDSTIHTAISPSILNKHQNKTFQKQLNFRMLREMDINQQKGVYHYDMNEDL